MTPNMLAPQPSNFPCLISLKYAQKRDLNITNRR